MENKNDYVKGLLLGSASFVMWGLLPIYWNLIHDVNSYLILAYRIFFSLIFVCVILMVQGNFHAFVELTKQKEVWKSIIVPAIFITLNWATYIWAVTNNHILETSLGYYINPLIITFFASVFLKEKMDKYQKIGLGLAFLGVMYKVVTYGQVPYVALLIATSFAVYGLAKKKSQLDTYTALAFETLAVVIPFFMFILYSEFTGRGISGNFPPIYWFLISLSGIATATPLLLYGAAAKYLPLNVLGFLQYISPTITLFLGVFVYNEPFDKNSLYSFSLIWIGIAFFTYSQYRVLKKAKDEGEPIIETTETISEIATEEVDTGDIEVG